VDGKINISIGSPIKRVIDGVIVWHEDHALKAWIHMVKAVRGHRKQHRKFEMRQKRIKRLEFEEWRRQQEVDDLREKLRHLS
jgi:predicted RNase H-like nuclease (RuvC/YqgF family)